MKNLINLFKTVFVRPSYLILAVVSAGGFVLANLWLANYQYLLFVASADFFSPLQKIILFFNVVELVKIRVDISSLWLVALLALLLGINSAALVFYFKRRLALGRAAGSSLVGLVLGFLGVGCAACGSVVLSAIFGITATSVFLGALPFGGYEFGWLALIFLAASLYLLAGKINNNFVCKI